MKTKKIIGVNPSGDGDHPPMSRDERTLLKRLMDNDVLFVERHYINEVETYGISFAWSLNSYPWSEPQWDRPVVMLLARELVRVITCAGGATWIRLR